MNKKDILAATLASTLVDTNSNDETAYIKRPSLSELVDYVLSNISNKFRGFTGLARKSRAGKNKYSNVGCSQDLSSMTTSSQVVESITTTEEIPTKKKRTVKKSVKKVEEVI